MTAYDVHFLPTLSNMSLTARASTAWRAPIAGKGLAVLASKLHSSTTKALRQTNKLVTPIDVLSRTAEPPLDCMESKPIAWTTNKWRQTDCLDNKQTDDRQWLHLKLFACPKSPCDPQRIRPKRQWLHRKLLASPSDGTLLSHMLPPKTQLAQTFSG